VKRERRYFHLHYLQLLERKIQLNLELSRLMLDKVTHILEERIATPHTVCTIVFHHYFVSADTRAVSDTNLIFFLAPWLQHSFLEYNQNTHFICWWR
jgi:hypothetical protein